MLRRSQKKKYMYQMFKMVISALTFLYVVRFPVFRIIMQTLRMKKLRRFHGDDKWRHNSSVCGLKKCWPRSVSVGQLFSFNKRSAPGSEEEIEYRNERGKKIRNLDWHFCRPSDSTALVNWTRCCLSISAIRCTFSRRKRRLVTF